MATLVRRATYSRVGGSAIIPVAPAPPGGHHGLGVSWGHPMSPLGQTAFKKNREILLKFFPFKNCEM